MLPCCECYVVFRHSVFGDNAKMSNHAVLRPLLSECLLASGTMHMVIKQPCRTEKQFFVNYISPFVNHRSVLRESSSLAHKELVDTNIT